jgi:hypothetical protein
MGTENDTTDRGYGGFADIQLLLDEQGAQHEQACETSQDHVSQMRLIDVQMIPRHGEDVGD